jgi:cysteine desulfurase/selenocysteine lyase
VSTENCSVAPAAPVGPWRRQAISARDPLAPLAELADWQAELREQFPILVAHPSQAYLDSAATAQKPQAVLDAVHSYLTTVNANAGRGSYRWANHATATVEAAKDRVRSFLRDPEPEHSSVHLVGGATAGLRAIALDWLPTWLRDGDEIVVPSRDHQANLVPWHETQRLLDCQGVGITIRPMPIDAAGEYDHEALRSLVTDRTRFVAATHVHHVYGGNMNVHRIRDAVGPQAAICLDAAQGVGHVPIDLRVLDVDFVVFSGHKAMALPGTGAIWSRNVRGPAFAPGGWDGSPNTTGAVSITAALDWLEAAGVDRIDRWTTALAAQLTDALAAKAGFEVLGCQTSLTLDGAAERRHGIVTFRHAEIPANDLGFVLADRGLMVRADAHCQGGSTPEDASVRVSLHAYSTPHEIERLIAALEPLEVSR